MATKVWSGWLDGDKKVDVEDMLKSVYEVSGQQVRECWLM